MSERQAIRDHAALLMRQQRDINALRRDIAKRLAAFIVDNGANRDTYDMALHVATRRELDRILAEYYGAYRGDPRAKLLRAILDSTARAFGLAVQRSQEIAAAATDEAPDVRAWLEFRGDAE